MTEYTGLQSILNAALGGYQAKGFRLVEKDDHVTLLYHYDTQVAIFNQAGLTIPNLHKECERYLAS